MDKLTDQIDKIKGLKQWLAHDSQKRPIVPSAFTDTENLMTYDEAVSVCRRQGLSGVGFSFIGSNICGIDLDHCIDKETGEVEEWALRIIDEIDSYTERSISGTGFHILFEANYKEQLRFDTYSVKGMRGDSLSSIEYCSKEEDRALRKDQRTRKYFRIDNHAPPDGIYAEILGYTNPVREGRTDRRKAVKPKTAVWFVYRVA